jgi:hypothetical protein
MERKYKENRDESVFRVGSKKVSQGENSYTDYFRKSKE